MSHFIIVCMLGLLASCTAHEGDSQPTQAAWSALPSPERATILALELGSTGRLYAGSEAGLFVSDDDGISWSVTTPIDWVVSSVLAVTESTILVGTYRRGAWRSEDGGHTWMPVGFEGNVYVDALTKDASGQVFAAVAHSVNDEPTGIFRSEDEGRNWIPTGLAGEDAFSICVIADDSMYAGTGSGTYHSHNGGSSWTLVDELPSSVPLSALVKIGDALIAGFAEPRHRAPGAGAWLSTDDGQSWVQMSGLPPETAVHSLWVDGDQVLAATGNMVGGGGTGLYKRNGKLSWEPLTLGDQWLRPLVGTPGGQLFVGAAESGMFVGSMASERWVSHSAGLRNWNPTALAHDKEGLLYALSLRSIFHYESETRTWSEAVTPKYAAAPTPFNFENLADGTLIMSGEGAVLFQLFGATGWERKQVPGARGPAISIHVSQDDRVFATFPADGTFESRDRGDSWVAVSTPQATRGVYRSSSGTQFAFGKGVHRRAESGAWEPTGLEEAMVFSLVDCDGELFLGSAPEGVFGSHDDGRTWTPLMDNLRRDAQQAGYIAVHSLLCLSDGSLVAATFSDGVFLFTKKHGWRAINQGLPTRSMGDLALGIDGTTYVVTSAGVYRRELPRQ